MQAVDLCNVWPVGCLVWSDANLQQMVLLYGIIWYDMVISHCHELLLLKDAAQKAGNWRTHVILVHSVSSSDIPNCWVWFFLQNSRDAHFCKRFSSPTLTGNGHHHFPLVECPMDGLWTSSAWLDERNLCQKGSYGWWGWWDKHR